MKYPKDDVDLPLSGVRVVELSNGKTDMCGRLLADLGAQVILVETPKGCPSRSVGPTIAGIDVYFATHAANKASVVVDPDSTEDGEDLKKLLSATDILIVSTAPDGESTPNSLDLAKLREMQPGLVILSISDFGRTGPYKNRKADNAAHLALAGVLARSGLEGRPPLLPPGKLAYETAAVQAAWCALVAFWQQQKTGHGDLLDFSIFEATAQIIDPVLGVTGSASGGKSATELTPRGRPEKFPLYPTFLCADGYVRVCILNPRQWRAMSTWLGDKHPFTNEKYCKLSERYKVLPEINRLIADLFRDSRKSDIVAEGQERGIPISAVATPREVVSNRHFNARGVFSVFTGTRDSRHGVVPAGYLEVDSHRAGIREHAPALGQHNDLLHTTHTAKCVLHEGAASDNRRPLADLRILDLGVIVAGAELGRLFADQGADVIKIESSKYPDGLRQSLTGDPMTASFAQGQRGKRSLGLNLRSEKGKELFVELAKQSDVILSNFKPGTLESLGLGYQDLKTHNPRLVMFDSSALGNTGPDAKTMGYGPLVRATAGLTGLWRYPSEDDSFSDSTTIFPDHFAARIAATGILATLIRRKRSGRGGTVSQSQAEAILVAMSDYYLRESLAPGSIEPGPDVGELAAPYGVFPCAGDDEWCTLGVHTDEQWKFFCEIVDIPSLSDDTKYRTVSTRWKHRTALARIASEWTRNKSPDEVVGLFQARGIPAARMLRIDEVAQNEHLRHRRFFRTLEQPQLGQSLLTENGPVGRSGLPDPDIQPAPTQFQHTRQIAQTLLGLDDLEIAQLIESGDLEVDNTSA